MVGGRSVGRLGGSGEGLGLGGVVHSGLWGGMGRSRTLGVMGGGWARFGAMDKVFEGGAVLSGLRGGSKAIPATAAVLGRG